MEQFVSPNFLSMSKDIRQITNDRTKDFLDIKYNCDNDTIFLLQLDRRIQINVNPGLEMKLTINFYGEYETINYFYTTLNTDKYKLQAKAPHLVPLLLLCHILEEKTESLLVNNQEAYDRSKDYGTPLSEYPNWGFPLEEGDFNEFSVLIHSFTDAFRKEEA
jgi:hypothetical protein